MFRVKLSDNTLPALFCALVLCAIGLGGCAAAKERWIGTVDTVFKYDQKDARTAVFQVPANSFSAEAGLKPGDILLTVDGADLSNASYEAVRAALQGPVGTLASLTVKRGDAVVELKVERAPVGRGTAPESPN